MPVYKVLSPLSHDTKLYKSGDTVEMPFKQAETLLGLGVLSESLGQSGEFPSQDDENSEPELDTEAPTLLDLNTADVDKLVALPHIGPAIAEKLIQARPFESLEDAQTASGLSKSKWSDLASLVGVGNSPL